MNFILIESILITLLVMVIMLLLIHWATTISIPQFSAHAERQRQKEVEKEKRQRKKEKWERTKEDAEQNRHKNYYDHCGICFPFEMRDGKPRFMDWPFCPQCYRYVTQTVGMRGYTLAACELCDTHVTLAEDHWSLLDETPIDTDFRDGRLEKFHFVSDPPPWDETKFSRANELVPSDENPKSDKANE